MVQAFLSPFFLLQIRIKIITIAPLAKDSSSPFHLLKQENLHHFVSESLTVPRNDAARGSPPLGTGLPKSLSPVATRGSPPCDAKLSQPMSLVVARSPSLSTRQSQSVSLVATRSPPLVQDSPSPLSISNKRICTIWYKTLPVHFSCCSKISTFPHKTVPVRNSCCKKISAIWCKTLPVRSLVAGRGSPPGSTRLSRSVSYVAARRSPPTCTRLSQAVSSSTTHSAASTPPWRTCWLIGLAFPGTTMLALPRTIPYRVLPGQCCRALSERGVSVGIKYYDKSKDNDRYYTMICFPTEC